MPKQTWWEVWASLSLLFRSPTLSCISPTSDTSLHKMSSWQYLSSPVPVMWLVPASLNLRPWSSHGKPGLSNLEWRSHVPDGPLQLSNVLLLVIDLLHCTGQMWSQSSVGALCLSNSMLEGLVCVIPALMHWWCISVGHVLNLSSESLWTWSGSFRKENASLTNLILSFL